MSDFAPPSGPPPPRVPAGWKAVFNQQYQEWHVTRHLFYVNLHTKQSQWDKPTEPAPSSDDAPPGYANPDAPHPSDTKRPFESNNPYSHPGGGQQGESDAELAARLQAEEDARARGHTPNPADRGSGDAYYGAGQNAPGSQGGFPGAPAGYDSNQPQAGLDSNQLPPRPVSSDRGKSRGFLGKILGKSSSSNQQYPPQQGYGQQQQYGGYQQGYPQQYQQGYGPPQGYYQQPMYAQQPPRRSGLGAGGGAALGLGGGLLGGMLLGEALDGGDGGGGGDDGGGGGGDDGGGGGGDF